MFKTINEDLQSALDKDPAARNKFEILLAYPGIHALLGYRLSHWFWKRELRFVARLISNLFRWLSGIEIHPGAIIGQRLFMDHGMGIVIGATAEVGDDCTIYQGVTLGGTSLHGGKRHPTLGNSVIVGAGAKVLGPLNIGDDVRVGSNSVVLQDVDDGCTIVGIPGRVLKKDDRQEDSKQKMHEKMDFESYGVSYDHPNPEAEAISLLVDRIDQLQQQVEQLQASQSPSSGADRTTGAKSTASSKSKAIQSSKSASAVVETVAETDSKKEVAKGTTKSIPKKATSRKSSKSSKSSASDTSIAPTDKADTTDTEKSS